MHVNINGVWRQVPEMKVCVQGVLRDMDRLELHNGVWRARYKHSNKTKTKKGT